MIFKIVLLASCPAFHSKVSLTRLPFLFLFLITSITIDPQFLFMSFTVHEREHRIEVDPEFLPLPAKKLVVTQHIHSVISPPRWAWIVVGAFYDEDDNIIWSTEVFVGHLDVELESDSESESEAGSEEDTTAVQDAEWPSPGKLLTDSCHDAGF